MSQTKRFTDPVLVLGANVTSLGLARILGKRGIDVYLAIDHKDDAIFSKYCKKSFKATGMEYDKEILKNLLIKIGKSLTKRIVVYPTSDLNALYLSELKYDLPDDYHFVVGDKEPVEILVKKSKFYKALHQSGIRYPVTYFPKDMNDVRQIGTKLTYPVFIRPSITQLFNQKFGHRKGLIAYSHKELMHYYRLTRKHNIEVMFQEIIHGSASNSYQLEGYYNKNHSPTVLFARQRLRIWPEGFGNTSLCVSISLAKLVKEEQIINDFIKKIGYHGLMSAEFKKDPRNGILKLLEINARAWWFIWLSTRCGADIVFSSYLDAIGENTNHVDEYETGVKSIWLRNDLMASAKAFLSGKLTFQGWIKSLLGVKQFTYFSIEDPSPFMMHCATMVSQILKSRA